MSQKKKSMLLFLVVALLLVLSLVAVFFLNSHSEQGEIARIYQDGKLIREVSLSDVASPYEFQGEASDGSYNLIRVEKGAIGIKDADCPDKICQQRGMVSDTGYPVTCLPHKLVIQIECLTAASDGIDAVAQYKSYSSPALAAISLSMISFGACS